MTGTTLTGTQGEWWGNRWLLAACIILTLVPLTYPPVLPLVDLPGHMGRYAVQLDPATFTSWYSFHWRLIGNLGVDLMMEPLGRLFGIEIATKLIVMTIPALTAVGLIWIAREVHGRVPPTIFFALPLAYGHPFIFGFVNYTLSVAVALLAFALWLRMARLGTARLRPLVFLPLACVVWMAHTFGWGMFGLLCASAELIRQRDLGKSWVAAAGGTVIACLPLAIPLIPMLVWRAQSTDMTGDWFDWGTKSLWILTTLRDRWQAFDLLSLGILFGVILFAIRDPRLTFSRNLATSAFVLLAVYVLLPRIIFGSAYADMRLTPFMFAVAIIAIRPTSTASTNMLGTIAMVGLALFATRIAATTVSLGIASARYDQALVALDHVPRGARVAAFTRRTCGVEWSTNRMEHLSALAIVRRHAFSNDQWDVSGAENMTVIKNDAPGFAVDPSQLLVPAACPGGAPWMTPGQALARLPRAAFDYVWLIDPPRFDVRLTRGMTPIWSNGPDHLYRIEHR